MHIKILLGFLVQRQFCNTNMQLAFTEQGDQAGLIKNYIMGNTNNSKNMKTVFYHCCWKYMNFQTQHFKGKTPLCLYFLPMMYNGATGGHMCAECPHFCMGAEKEEKHCRLSQHKPERNTWRMQNSFKKQCLKKPQTNNQEVSNLKGFS